MKLHEFLDDNIKLIIEFDFPHYLSEYSNCYFDDVDVQIINVGYYNPDLIQLSVFGYVKYLNDIFLTSFVIRKDDVDKEFNGDVQEVISYIKDKLLKHNDSLKAECNK